MEYFYFIKALRIVRYILIFCIILFVFKVTANERLYLAFNDQCPYTCADKPQKSLVVTIMNEVYKQENIGVELVLIPFSRVMKLIITGRASGKKDSQIIHAVFMTKADNPDLIFPKIPVVKDNQCFYTLNDSLWKYNPTLQSDNVVLGVKAGSNFPEIERLIYSLKAKNKLTEISPSNGFEHLFKMLLKKRIDAIYDVSASIEYIAGKHNAGKLIKKGWCESNYVEGVIGFSPAYPKKSAMLAKIWDENYPKLLAQGAFDSIFDSYDLTKPLIEVSN